LVLRVGTPCVGLVLSEREIRRIVRKSIWAFDVVGTCYAIFIGMTCHILEAANTGACRSFALVVEFVRALKLIVLVCVASINMIISFTTPGPQFVKIPCA
jgi:hypothetical protein